MACTPVTKASIVLSSGLVVLIVGVVLGWYGFQQIVISVIKSESVLVEGSKTYDLWASSPIPIYMEFHIFHCTNPDGVGKGEKPNLVEKGPYVFKETRDKGNVSFQDDRPTVTYKEYDHYYFDAERTGPNASLSDMITMLNPFYVGFASYADGLNLSILELRLINELLTAHNQTLYMNQTAGDLLFHGWDITEWIDLYKILQKRVPELPDPPQSLMDNPYIGLFQKNGSNDGEYVMHTGKGDYTKLGTILTWKNQTSLQNWEGPECNMINGTDGTLYSPLLGIDDKLYIFNSDLCRSIYAEFESDTEVLGIKARRFTVREYVLANYTENPDNFCFCLTPETPELCYGASILDLRNCAHDAPVLMSTPHFYQGDQRYIDAIGNMNPQKELHETYFDLEPLSSAPLSAAKRIQINIDLKKYSWINTEYRKLKEVIHPVMWVNEYADIDQSLADEINSQLFGPINTLKVVRWVIVGIGAFVLLLGSIMLTKAVRKSRELV